MQIGTQLRTGQTGDIGQPRCTQVYAEVEYTGLNQNPEIRTTQLYAVVNYTPSASTVTLSTPEHLSISHSRDIGRHTFPSGDYEVDDYGRGGKTLRIRGREVSSASAKMQSVKDMCHYGNAVTIAGLPDTNLNTDYMIRSFNFEQLPGEIDIYRWTLILEES